MGLRTSKALWHIDTTSSEVRDEVLNELVGSRPLQSTFSLISLGTELLIAKGMVPEQFAKHMAVPYMSGELTLPVKYGYSIVGRDPNTGEAFHCMHPHESFCQVSHQDLYPIPVDIPLKRAVLASNMETAVNAIWDARLLQGSTVLVVGFGMIGSLVARTAMFLSQAQVVVAETNPRRADYARELGFTVETDVPAGYFDVAFHTSASEKGLQQAITAVGMEGVVVELSWYGSRKVTLELGGDFHYDRKRIISSQVSHIPLYQQRKWTFAKRKGLVFELLSDPMYDRHLTHELTLHEAAQLFGQWRTEPPEGLGYVIKY